MQSRPWAPDASVDFVCPYCGVSAFEVVPEPSGWDHDTDNAGVLFVKCFGCDGISQHSIEDVRMVMACAAD